MSVYNGHKGRVRDIELGRGTEVVTRAIFRERGDVGRIKDCFDDTEKEEDKNIFSVDLVSYTHNSRPSFSLIPHISSREDYFRIMNSVLLGGLNHENIPDDAITTLPSVSDVNHNKYFATFSTNGNGTQRGTTPFLFIVPYREYRSFRRTRENFSLIVAPSERGIVALVKDRDLLINRGFWPLNVTYSLGSHFRLQKTITHGGKVYSLILTRAED